MKLSKVQKKRLKLILCVFLGISLAIFFIIRALKNNLNLYYTLEALQQTSLSPEQTIRIGGLVEKNSVKRQADNLMVNFRITDLKRHLLVHYEGALPDLFREGQGVVLRGRMQQGAFIADEVLAKHDEKYMPKEVKDALLAAKGRH